MVEFCMTEVICFSGESWIKRFCLKNIQDYQNKIHTQFQVEIVVCMIQNIPYSK